MKQVLELGMGIERALHKPLSPKVRDMRKSGTVRTMPRIKVAVSPMRRTLLTAVPVVNSLEQLHESQKLSLDSVEVVPFIYEVGGCYSEKAGVFVGHSGLSDVEAKEILPRAQTHASMKSGWWSSNTRETEEQLEVRVTRTLEWVRKQACDGDCEVLIVITHQDFACTCIRRLAQISGVNWLYNTSLSSFTLHPISSSELDPERVDNASDGSVAQVHHCKVVMDWLNSIDHLSFQNIT
jgi:broad specificity phosphatase PhoE